ncbi:hypothetical protein E2C01_069972 [Portunus trituberculatus]|uniref:Uncharacterized protein n=1 Tax=Portunus trituberculatus TaxID=210409 RepID=A0A5B7HVY8_PORTR|nr:hypothetical protein [Portunus trituberculatus]
MAIGMILGAGGRLQLL